MIYINLNNLSIPATWGSRARQLTRELAALPPEERPGFIEKNREDTWGADEVLKALREIVGNKCWYSEVPLEGADPNIDHFRPKGQVREVDEELKNTKKTSPGYWWLAFDCQNFRLSSMHANQRRVDADTNGGKWDYFPVLGSRAAEGTIWTLIAENSLALDPCSASDVALLWFDPDGNPCYSKGKRKPNELDQQRVRTTVWLYHLDKQEIVIRRGQHIRRIFADLRDADAQYKVWDRDSASPNLQAKISFDRRIADIKAELSDSAEFAGAKRCAVRAATADYDWIDEFGLV
jgi:hypothetical protein